MRYFILSVILFLSFKELSAQKSNFNYVNPFIGTGGHGHTYPGVTMPFGMVQLSPDTRLDGWDGCSGYHYTDSIVYGFSHTHLSGTGVSDYGDILLMPTTGEVRLNNGENGQPGYRSRFEKMFQESATPANYRMILNDYDIEVSLAATTHCGFHHYKFPRNATKNLILDLKHRDKVLEADFQQVNDSTVQGYRYSNAWAKEQKIYFYLQTSQPFKLEKKISENDKNLIGGFVFLNKNNRDVYIKIGISYVSMEGAKENLSAEIPTWDMQKIFLDNTKIWNDLLSKVQVESPNENDKTSFYTALFHLYQVPNVIQDVNNQYLGMDLKSHKATGYEHYSVFSLWDTYRAAHPLYTILQPKRVNDFVKTFLNDFDKSGALPMWPLPGNETWCMIGNHATPVIADACIKGIKDFDKNHALEAMIKTAHIDHFGQKEYAKYGFIPAELEHESVSKTIEYAYDDYCISQMAREVGDQITYKKYIKRAQNYKNVFNPANGFVQAKINQTWVTPFAPEEVNSHFTEGNSWHYSFSAPHDMSGWIKLHGGKAAAEAKLDALFAANSKTSGRDQADLTGLIGQYVQGNEPSHHIAYLYNFLGKPYKTQALIHQIMNDFYKNEPDGLIGNEDCGQMSAWYIFSALGFYPVNPCGGQYIIGTPRFPFTEIKLEDNKSFIIRALDVSENNFYIQSATLNGKALTHSWIMHDEIMKGGELVFQMGNKPSNWAILDKDLPISEILGNQIVPLPFIAKGERSFRDATNIEFGCAEKDATVFYESKNQLNKEAPKSYQSPISITQSTTFSFWAIHNKTKQSSDTIIASFSKIPVNRSITLKNKYAPQYSAGGDRALIDFVRGNKNYHTGSWQGYEGVDCEVVIDLENEKNITKIGIGVLQDHNAWIFAPTEVQFLVSNDNVHFEPFYNFKNEIEEQAEGAIVKDYSVEKAGKARYIKVIAKNRGFCPEWHKGAKDKGKAWIFLDEITIE